MKVIVFLLVLFGLVSSAAAESWVLWTFHANTQPWTAERTVASRQTCVDAAIFLAQAVSAFNNNIPVTQTSRGAKVAYSEFACFPAGVTPK